MRVKVAIKTSILRLGELAHFPVADHSVDVLISNCVINLTLTRRRSLKKRSACGSKGRFAVSDIVLLKELPDAVKQSVAAYVGCLSGAIMKDAYLETIRAAGFEGVRIVDEAAFPFDWMANDLTAQIIGGSRA